MSETAWQSLPGSTQGAPDRSWFFDALPWRPRPYPDECLSGYLLRLAQANRFFSFWDLLNDLFPALDQPSRVSILCWEYPVDDWGRLPQRTQLSRSALKTLTVWPLVAKFRSPPVVTLPSHSGPGSFLRGVVNPHLQVCPRCLREESYLRLAWRLAIVQACVQHGCLLQVQCHRCGTLLAAVGATHRHLHCAVCDTDLRTLPVVAATADMLEAQQRRQAELRFLLEPEVALVKEPTCEPGVGIGLKFRYLRVQAGYSVKAMARQVGVLPDTISAIELGQERPSLAYYLAYLEALSWSWSGFAALQVPDEFVRSLEEPPLLHLRLCPSPECPNHQPPPGMGVTLLRDLPGWQRARFRCRACGRRFTRTYEGELAIKPRRSPLPPGRLSRGLKSAEEIARLVELGQQGVNNRQIARQLGWGQKAVRLYWEALGLEEQVHEAQAQRRTQEQQERYTALCDRVETILRSLLAQGEEISARCVSRALGCNGDFLQTYPDLKAYVQRLAEEHNPRVRQRRSEALSERLAQAIEEAKQHDRAMTLRGIEQQAGLCLGALVRSYPDLHAMVRRAVQEHQAERKATCTAARCARVNDAAARLVAQGTRLTYKAILRAAGLNLSLAKLDPAVLSQLRQWLGDFAPRD